MFRRIKIFDYKSQLLYDGGYFPNYKISYSFDSKTIEFTFNEIFNYDYKNLNTSRNELETLKKYSSINSTGKAMDGGESIIIQKNTYFFILSLHEPNNSHFLIYLNEIIEQII